MGIGKKPDMPIGAMTPVMYICRRPMYPKEFVDIDRSTHEPMGIWAADGPFTLLATKEVY